MTRIVLRWVVLWMLAVSLMGCFRTNGRAPVDHIVATFGTNASQYRVKSGDTLYSIAWAYDVDYRVLAQWNHLRYPYRIATGQVLRVKPPHRVHQASRKENILYHRRHQRPHAGLISASEVASGKHTVYPSHHHPVLIRVSPRARRHHHINHHVNHHVNRAEIHWVWPARGRVVAGFQQRFGGNRGINIEGHFKEKVFAAARGVVVYSGAGVSGYGNLIIVKHNADYLSAYAYNQQLLVKLGQRVKAGQPIAAMGKDGSGRAVLHFEIRYRGRPVNPRHYLPHFH